MEEGQEGAKVRIVCPTCGGSFKGRLPAKPARGTCPRCKKDLVLLPTGAIDTETKFRRKREDIKESPPPIPSGAKPAAPAPLAAKKTPMFHPTGEAIPPSKPPSAPETTKDRMKDYGVAVALLLIGWILTGALVYLREKPQITELGKIGSQGLSEIRMKICGE